MFKIIAFIIGLILPIGGYSLYQENESTTLGAFSDPFVSIQLATNPSNGDCLTTDGSNNVWDACGGGGGSSKWTDYSTFIAPTDGLYASAPTFVGTSTTAFSTFYNASSTNFQSDLAVIGSQGGGFSTNPLDVVTTGGATLRIARNDSTVLSGDRLGVLIFSGNDGNDNSSAGIEVLATQNHSATARGAEMIFSTTGNGTASRTDRWYITNQGTFAPLSDNAYDLGGSGLRIANGYFGTLLTSPLITASSTEVDNGTTTNVIASTLKALTSGGLALYSNNGTQIADFGAGGGANATFFGGVNIDGQTRLATSLTGLLRADSGVVSIDGGTYGQSNWIFDGTRLTPSTTVGIGVFASSTISDLSSTYSTSTNLFATQASGTRLYGFGLTDCDSASNALTWDLSTALFGCNTISAGVTGNTGELPYFSNTNTLTATSSIFLNNLGYFGIGTTTPNAALTVRQNLPAANQIIFRVNTSDDVSRFSIDEDGDVLADGTIGITGAATFSSTVAATGAVSSAADIFTTGAGDDLWLGTATQASSLAEMLATGVTTLGTTTGSSSAMLTVNGLTVSGSLIATTSILTNNLQATNATSSNLFSAIANFTTGFIDTFTSTLANITTGIFTNLTATNATSTNATSTNLYATNTSLPDDLFSFSIASTSAKFATGTVSYLPMRPYAYTVTDIDCFVVGGTSKVVTIFGESLTCDTDGTIDDGSIAIPNVGAASTTVSFTIGDTVGVVNDILINVYGRKLFR